MLSCPSCRQQFELTDAVRSQISSRLDDEVRQQMDEARRQERLLMEKQMKAALKDHNAELSAMREKLTGVEKRELAALQAERKLADLKLELQLQTEKTLQKERESIRAAVESSLSQRYRREILEREEMAAEIQKRLDVSEKAHKELLAGRAELERRERALELEIEKRLQASKGDAVKQAREQLQAENRLQLEAREMEIQRLKAQVVKLSEAARTTGVAGEVSGESLERVLRETLMAVCPADRLDEVQRGQFGADIIQTVRNPAQAEVGRIVWEAKNTAKWNNAWIEKTKKAQQQSNAEVSVIVTRAMPRELEGSFGLFQGVWVVHLDAAGAVAAVIRHMLLKLYSVRMVSEARDTRFRLLYDYLLSPAFRLQCEGVVRAVQSMQAQLDSEQRSMTRAWASRQKHLQALGGQVATMIGSLEGALGTEELPEGGVLCDVESLEIPLADSAVS